MKKNMKGNTDFEQIKSLMKKPKQIRNVCIISHIDHGKTSLSDNFLASAGLINPNEAGKKLVLHKGMEKERGITIDSSVVTFVYRKK